MEEKKIWGTYWLTLSLRSHSSSHQRRWRATLSVAAWRSPPLRRTRRNSARALASRSPMQRTLSAAAASALVVTLSSCKREGSSTPQAGLSCRSSTQPKRTSKGRQTWHCQSPPSHSYSAPEPGRLQEKTLVLLRIKKELGLLTGTNADEVFYTS